MRHLPSSFLFTLFALVAIPAGVTLAQSDLVFDQHARIVSVDGMKTTFKPGEKATLTIKTVEKDGTIAADQRGWNIQWSTYYGPTRNPRVNLDAYNGGPGQYGNAHYANGSWTIDYIAPTENSKFYIGISLYCADDKLACGKLTYFQLDKDIEFSVDSSNVVSSKRIEFHDENPVSTCTDTDGGKEPRQKGTVTTTGVSVLGDGKMQDSCVAEILYEYSCENNKAVRSAITCPGGCSDGVCQREKFMNGQPKILGMRVTPDALNCAPQNGKPVSCSAYDLWFDVLKADGSKPTVEDGNGKIQAWLSSWFSQTKRYSTPSLIGLWPLKDGSDVASFHMSFSVDSTRTTTNRFLLRLRQGQQSVRKQFTVTVTPAGKVTVKP